MLICESCGAVFAFPSSQMDNETGCVEEFCPECHSRYIMKAASCQVCGGWVAEDDAFGYGGSTVCDECLNAASSDLDLLYRATKDECEDFELPVLFRTFFTDDEILEILMRELKACHAQVPRETKSFVRRYANEIADEMVKEAEMMQEYKKLVEALRYCKVDYCSSCVGCPMYADYEGSECINEMHDDAADAIEELQKTLKAVQKNSGINFRMWKEAVTEAKSGSTNSCSIKNPEIKIGDTIRCLNCNKKIILDSNTFVFDFSGEYIVCPSCGATYDVSQYHIYGEKCDRKEE